ncbi:MAG: hypothetical protein H6702_24975 [Myxococcales bacterium]|nr:hypothetical protein [Myxococcales bacterium]
MIAALLALLALAAPPAPAAAPAALSSAAAPPLDIQADTVELDQQTGRAVFTGAVRATQGPTTLTCARLTARLDESGGLSDLEASEVTVTSGGWTATAGRARYDKAKDELTLTGAPTVVRGQTRLTGETVTVWPGQGKVTVRHAKGRVPAPPLLDLERALGK